MLDPLSFCYWLQGHFELNDTNSLDEVQVQMIRDHLQLVFNKVTPNRTEAKISSSEDIKKLEKTIHDEMNKAVMINVNPLETMSFCMSNDVDEDGYRKLYESIPHGVSC